MKKISKRSFLLFSILFPFIFFKPTWSHSNKPNLLVCGHSHILKIARDEKYNLIYVNPGAVGKVGFHKEKTMVRFNLVDDKIEDMQVIKLDG